MNSDQLLTVKPFVSRCTGRIPVPSDPNVPWTPDLLEKLFPKVKRAAWGEVIALTAQTSTEPDDNAKAG